MICPVEIAHDMSALRAVRIGDHAEHGSLSEGRDGAGDESTGCNVAGNGEEDHLVSSGGDPGDQVRAPGGGGEKVFALYREKYFDLNVQHFHEKLQAEHGIELSYTWVKQALQGAGLVARGRKRGVHRKRRERRPLPGMLLHIDGSRHQWFQDERWYDLIVILDDASSEIYYAQLVEEESTVTVMAGLRQVIERKGVFCALYSDRGSHFWLTPKAGGRVDPHRLTQVGRALRDLGVQMIPAYSPQARGRSERNFGTWQGRLPQELRLHGISTLAEANRFLREHYVAEFNRRFQVPAAQRGTHFTACPRRDLNLIFSLQFERTIARDNTVSFQNMTLQIDKVNWRGTLAGCTVIVHQHLDRTLSITHGPRRLGNYTTQGSPIKTISAAKAVEKTHGGKVQKRTFPPCLEIPPTKRDSHFPTATTTAG